MNVVDLIRAKRDGYALSAEELQWLIRQYTDGQIPDYQIAAFLMATVWRGMTDEETVALTLAMADSGERLHLGTLIAPVVDKHSTGGVGDKVTLVVGPLVAACGLAVGKMSGRGLGHSGGTIDKLESITGFRAELSKDEFIALVRAHGIAIAAQSGDLAPADGKIYALRDVTATIDSLPLIASSVMSKKLAVGPTHLLLDVKTGSGAFMKTEKDARALARLMVRIGEDAGIRTAAFITAMDQPLGRAIGNALEVAEAVDVLRDGGPADVREIALHEAGALLHLAGLARTAAAGEQRAQKALADGSALARFAEIVTAQGGDAARIEDTARLPQAPHREYVNAPRTGYIAHIEADTLGLLSVRLGAGRQRKGDPIDPSVGLVLQAKVGDRVEAGQPLLAVHAANEQDAAAIREGLLAAYTWSDEPVQPPPLVLGRITRKDV